MRNFGGSCILTWCVLKTLFLGTIPPLTLVTLPACSKFQNPTKHMGSGATKDHSCLIRQLTDNVKNNDFHDSDEMGYM